MTTPTTPAPAPQLGECDYATPYHATPHERGPNCRAWRPLSPAPEPGDEPPRVLGMPVVVAPVAPNMPKPVEFILCSCWKPFEDRSGKPLCVHERIAKQRLDERPVPASEETGTAPGVGVTRAARLEFANLALDATLKILAEREMAEPHKGYDGARAIQELREWVGRLADRAAPAPSSGPAPRDAANEPPQGRDALAPHFDAQGRIKHHCSRDFCPDMNEGSMVLLAAPPPSAEAPPAASVVYTTSSAAPDTRIPIAATQPPAVTGQVNITPAPSPAPSGPGLPEERLAPLDALAAEWAKDAREWREMSEEAGMNEGVRAERHGRYRECQHHAKQIRAALAEVRSGRSGRGGGR